MVEFTATILQFDNKGEKTGWTYLSVPADITESLMPGNKKSFKVKGMLDECNFKGMNLYPMGGGTFIMALNTTVRKKLHKGKGAMLRVQLEVDNTLFEVPEWMTACLEDEPIAKERFNALPRSHQNYYIKWIESAKTEQTRTRRTAQVVSSFVMGIDFGEMLRMNRDNKFS